MELTAPVHRISANLFKKQEPEVFCKKILLLKVLQNSQEQEKEHLFFRTSATDASEKIFSSTSISSLSFLFFGKLRSNYTQIKASIYRKYPNLVRIKK